MDKLEGALLFLLGFFSCALIGLAIFGFNLTGFAVANSNYVVNSPSDWVDKSDIFVFPEEVIIKVEGATLVNYAPTGSMKPVLGVNTIGIRVVPQTEAGIGIGDIVSFRQGNELVVHRVVEKGIDSGGVYFVTKGDNSDFVDGKIRFEDIEYVTVGVIW